MMEVYRIAKTESIRDLSGYGARTFGGRWHHKGTGVVYTSETRALATTEYLVHVPVSLVPDDLSIATITIPEGASIQAVDINDLPANWRDYPADPALADFGSGWVGRSDSLLLRVPSVIVEKEFNILINPMHPEFGGVSITAVDRYQFNPRLLRS